MSSAFSRQNMGYMRILLQFTQRHIPSTLDGYIYKKIVAGQPSYTAARRKPNHILFVALSAVTRASACITIVKSTASKYNRSWDLPKYSNAAGLPLCLPCHAPQTESLWACQVGRHVTKHFRAEGLGFRIPSFRVYKCHLR